MRVVVARLLRVLTTPGAGWHWNATTAAEGMSAAAAAQRASVVFIAVCVLGSGCRGRSASIGGRLSGSQAQADVSGLDRRRCALLEDPLRRSASGAVLRRRACVRVCTCVSIKVCNAQRPLALT